jgi:hypothetical protein
MYIRELPNPNPQTHSLTQPHTRLSPLWPPPPRSLSLLGTDTPSPSPSTYCCEAQHRRPLTPLLAGAAWNPPAAGRCGCATGLEIGSTWVFEAAPQALATLFQKLAWIRSPRATGSKQDMALDYQSSRSRHKLFCPLPCFDVSFIFFNALVRL